MFFNISNLSKSPLGKQHIYLQYRNHKKKQQEKNIRFELCERKPNSFRPKANWIDIFIVSGQTEYL